MKNLDEKDYDKIEQNIADLIDKTACSIIERGNKGDATKFLQFIDKYLLYLLYNRETIIEKEGLNNEKIYKIIDKYENYKDLVREKVISNFSDYDKNLLNAYIYGGVSRLILLVTHSCQLRCSYCRVRKFDAWMSEKVMKKAIELLFTSSKNDLQFQFFGGEPLLNFGIVKKAVEYASKINKKHRKNLLFILTTNGIELTQDRINFLKKNNFLVECSFDGTVETQLKSRRAVNGTDYYSIAVNNFKNLFTSGVPCYAISVVMPTNVKDMVSNFRHIVDLGFRKAQINYSLGVFWDDKSFEKFLEGMNNIIELSKRDNVELINLKESRSEPVVLNAELTVDFDGDIFLETGICLEEDFIKMKNSFKVVSIYDCNDINIYATTKFSNFNFLSKVYGSKPEFRRIILNNIMSGKKVLDFIKMKKENSK